MDITPLKRLLMEQGRKNKWLAKEVGIEESTISQIVTGKRVPTLKVAIKIARVMGTTVENLWGWAVDDDDENNG